MSQFETGCLGEEGSEERSRLLMSAREIGLITSGNCCIVTVAARASRGEQRLSSRNQGSVRHPKLSPETTSSGIIEVLGRK